MTETMLNGNIVAATFVIKPAQAEEVSEKKQVFCKIFFALTINGSPIQVPKNVEVQHEGITLRFGECYGREIFDTRLTMNGFGFLEARSPVDNEILLKMEPKLEGLFRQAALKMIGETISVEGVRNVRNLLTGEQVTPPDLQPVPLFEFQAPREIIVKKLVDKPAQIFWNPGAVALNKIICGKADQLTVRWPAAALGWDAATNTYSVAARGWQGTGVDAMRSKFSDEIITAAFHDMAKAAFESDDTPKNAITWIATTKTVSQLVLTSETTEST